MKQSTRIGTALFKPGGSSALAEFAADLSFSAIPDVVLERARLHILDGLGLALASGKHPFAAAAIAAAQELAGGTGLCSVIGHAARLPPRDAALVNGILIHGLDFDDTHQQAIVHPTAACLPAILALAEARNATGKDLLTAYCIGMEAAIRIGASVKSGFHHAGFHATSVVAHFSSALSAGRLMNLDKHGLIAAQGIAASTASGVQVFLEEGAWTKRFHPGWAAVAGITAATLAKNDFKAPSRPYEGQFGLYETHLQAHRDKVDESFLSSDLGSVWMTVDTALKPYPVCHFIHGAAEAAILLHSEIKGAKIASVEVLLGADSLPIIADPIEAKRRASNEYEAKFSAPFVVATALLRGRFGLAELTDEAIAATDVQALAKRVSCAPDPHSQFPIYFSGDVRVKLADGRELCHNIPVNSGAGDRQLDEAAVTKKFMANAAPVLGEAQSDKLKQVVLDLENIQARELANLFSAVAQ